MANTWSFSVTGALPSFVTPSITGRADGVFSTVPFVLPIVAANRPADAILFADYGLEFPSFGLFATEDRGIGMESFVANGPGKAEFTGR